MKKQASSVAVTMKRYPHKGAMLTSSISARCSLYSSLSHAGDVISQLSPCLVSTESCWAVLSTAMQSRSSCARWSTQLYREQSAQL